ncbi:MAG: glycosyltransferase family 2 protein [Bacteroidota bacterium]|nr:glycosyltransferase family 2 protein [Bacteroidota bacterium]
MEFINFQILTVSDIALLVLFSVTFIVQMYFLLGVYLKLVLHRKEDFNPELSPVTIILPLRNEESGIRELVTKFTALPFNDYQLIVIDEVSEDDTLHILNILAETNPRLKVTSLSQENRFQEKQSINIGLKGASSPWIVQLTANSAPVSDEWLSKLGGLHDNNTDAVIAYTNVERKKGYRNLICRLELFSQFMISGSRILTGNPFVFSENNVLFRKSMYFDNQGFKHKLNLNFANLELIFNENFRKGRIKITTNPEIAVRERIEDDRGDHIKLLKKTVQIKQNLSWGKKANLFLDDFTKISFIGVAISLIILHTEYWITFSSVLLIYFVTSLIIVKNLLTRLKERKIFVPSFFYILIKPIINCCFFWSMYLIHRRSRWN